MVWGELKVRSVFDEETRSGWNEPAWDNDWSDLMKLRYLAAVAGLDGGIPLTVTFGASTRDGVMDLDSYGLSGPNFGIGPLDFNTCAAYIHGLDSGWWSRKSIERKSDNEK